MSKASATRWVLVAGTGLEIGTPNADVLAAEALGEQLAQHRYGLISGGWHGVDYVVTESFVRWLRMDGKDPNEYLIQVVPEGKQPSHQSGRIIMARHGASEWLEPQNYADAVVLIGGRGGTYRTWLGALTDGLPRFPLGGTQGDAERAFRETIDLWELMPIPGVTLDNFEKLGKAILLRSDAEAVAKHLVEELLWRSLTAADALSRGNVEAAASIFICYSRKDSDWVSRLRTLIRPLERHGIILTWSDADLEPGKAWEEHLIARLREARAALIFVSANLLSSDYVRSVELPALMKRTGSPASSFHLFWVLLDACDWRSTELRHVQALDTMTPLTQSGSRADEQCRLIGIVESMARILSK